MKIIQIGNTKEDIKQMTSSWKSPESFVLLPNIHEVDLDWLNKTLEQLPVALQKQHFILLTSGSTGQPKLVVGSKERATSLVHLLHQEQKSHTVQETLLALPLTYCYAFVNQWLWSFVYQKELKISNGFKEPERLRQMLENAQDAMLCLVGAQVPLIERYFQGSSFTGIIRLHFAGGRFPQEKMEQILTYFPHAKVFNNYGCAEAMPRLSIRPLEASDVPGNIGKPLPGIVFRTEETGELFFQSPFGSVGSLDHKGFHPITKESWVSTGDIAEQNEDNTWNLLGRANQVFKRHGEKISLSRLLETVGRSWKGQAAFYREPDKHGEEGHILLIAPQITPEQIREVLKSLRKNHPRAHWPLRIESVPSIPLLHNGKIDLLAIKEIRDKQVHWYQRL